MRTGEFRDQISLTATGENVDPINGDQTGSPTLLGIVWAKVQQTGGGRNLRGGEVTNNKSYVIEIRKPAFSLHEGIIIFYKGKTLHVQSIIENDAEGLATITAVETS